MLEKYRTDDVTQPVGGRIVMTDVWWSCLDGDPTKALFYGKGNSPQCNSSKDIAERLAHLNPDASIVFMPVAYVKHTCDSQC